MISMRRKYLILISCILLSVWLLVAQVLGRSIIVIPCLLMFLFLMIWAATKGIALPVILFFLPFAPLLRIRQGTISFFTIALLGIFLYYAIVKSRNMRIYHIIPALCVILLTMVVKIACGYSFENGYIFFAVSLLLFPFITKEIGNQYDFHLLTLFFVLGITLAAITARYLIVFPNILKFIRTVDLFGTVRFAGYYGDPNYYSAHITAALAGVLIQLLGTPSRNKVVTLVIMVGTLIYCGMLSVSKMFFLISVCLVLLWILAVLLKKGKISTKVTLILAMCISAISLLASTVFTDLFDAMIARFGRDNNISDFTTGRTDVWVRYIRTLVETPVLLLFGKGYTNVLIGEKASHNTIIQAIYQFGLFGGAFIAGWFGSLVHNLFCNIRFKWNQTAAVMILLIGVLGPWLALDLVFFDEFFILPLYMLVGMGYLLQEN